MLLTEKFSGQYGGLHRDLGWAHTAEAVASCSKYSQYREIQVVGSVANIKMFLSDVLAQSMRGSERNFSIRLTKPTLAVVLTTTSLNKSCPWKTI